MKSTELLGSSFSLFWATKEFSYDVISSTWHLPKSASNCKTQDYNVGGEMGQGRERNREHSRLGESKPKPERKKVVVTEQMWFIIWLLLFHDPRSLSFHHSWITKTSYVSCQLGFDFVLERSEMLAEWNAAKIQEIDRFSSSLLCNVQQPEMDWWLPDWVYLLYKITHLTTTMASKDSKLHLTELLKNNNLPSESEFQEAFELCSKSQEVLLQIDTELQEKRVGV